MELEAFAYHLVCGGLVGYWCRLWVWSFVFIGVDVSIWWSCVYIGVYFVRGMFFPLGVSPIYGAF